MPLRVAKNQGNRRPPPSILVVTDNPEIEDTIRDKLQPQYEIQCVHNASHCLRLVEDEHFDCVLVDIGPSHDSTTALLTDLKRKATGLPVLVLCTTPDISAAVEAIRAGAADFIIKEVEIDGVAGRISKLLAQSQAVRKCEQPLPNTDRSWKPGRMVVGNSPQMQEIMRLARQVAVFPVPVLLLGESGTGKELLARWFHRNSGRADGPFVAVNLAAIPTELVESTLFGHEKGAFTGASGPRTGKFAQAQSGTLLLDEITEFQPELQPKLLRVLQEGEFERVGGDRRIQTDARIIAATNKDIVDSVDRGEFRSDLYYRLNVVSITLPALRERRDDVPELASFFIQKCNHSFGCSVQGIEPEALDALMDYDWPGNIRELENVVKRAVIYTVEGRIGLGSLGCLQGTAKNKMVEKLADQNGSLEDLERCYIQEILRRTEGHQGNAAKILGIDRKTLYNKLLKYGVSRDPKRVDDQDDLSCQNRGKIAS